MTPQRFSSEGLDSPAFHAGFLQQLDARTKILMLIAVTIATFATRLPWVALALALAAAGAALFSGVKVRSLIADLKPTVVILALALLANTLVIDASGEIPLAGPVGLSLAGFERAALAVFRIVSVVAWCVVIAATTTVGALTAALSSFLWPLRHVGVPVYQVATMLSLALRFVPDAQSELERLMCAQSARGVDFSAGNLSMRLKRYTSIFVPLIVALFKRANTVSEAMLDRGFGAAEPVHERRALASADWLILAISAALSAVVIVWGGR